MSNFFQQNWKYILVGFIVVVLVGLGLFTYLQLSGEKTKTLESSPTNKPAVNKETDQSFDISSNNARSAEVSFSINPFGDDIQCLELSSSPEQGKPPLTVTFSGASYAPPSSTITYTFSFGDGEEESVEKTVQSADGIEIYDVTHTYLEEEAYTASLVITAGDKIVTSPTCETIVLVSNKAEVGETNKEISTIEPTISPSPTSTEQELLLPDIPEAGGFPPTIIATLGGFVVILLAMLL